MTYTELIKRVEELVGAKQENFAKATLKDGETEVLTDGESIGEGQKLFVRDSEGNRQAAPEGSHTLSDGRTVTVDGEGTITEVADAEPDGEPEGEPASGDTPTRQELEDTKRRMDNMEKAVQEMAENMGSEEKEMEKQVEELSKAYEELSKSPAGQPAEYDSLAKELFNKDSKDLTLAERVQINLKNQ